MATVKVDEAAIFNRARQIAAAEERQRYLHEACGDDRALQARIEALLHVHEAGGSFLESPTKEFHALLGETEREGPGTQIGPYKLLEQLGQGGMGTVYLAEQLQPVQRRVALKIIRPGLDSRQIIARFEAERQALALMDHPNIAKVLDAGTTEEKGERGRRKEEKKQELAADSSFILHPSSFQSGRPYFVMELVRGLPITVYCDAQRLPLRQRLALFVPVCQAVQHAHQKGIIHRDLKPSNILVARYDDRPVPKVIDFGIAKAMGAKLTEQTLHTEFGSVVGTLEYMSPEQAEPGQADVDTRSDVYALGVILYELLTGTTPLQPRRFAGAALLDLLRRVREEDPPPPSTRLHNTQELPTIAANRGVEPRRLRGLLRGDLDWIVMKCLEKDRTRRYETANALARDLERYLHGEPVEASPPSARYRLRKFAQKNQKLLGAVAGFVLVLVIGTVVSVWQAVRATQAEQAEKRAHVELVSRNEELVRVVADEIQARQDLQKQKERADANLLITLGLLEKNLLDGKKSDQKEWLGRRKRQELQELLDRFQALRQINSDGPPMMQLLAQAYGQMAAVQEVLGEYAGAEDSLGKARHLQERLRQEAPQNSAYQDAVAGTWHELGHVLANARRIDKAEAAYREAIRLHQALVASSPEPAYRVALARHFHNLGNLLAGDPQRKPQARAAYEEAIKLHEQLASERPSAAYREALEQHRYKLRILDGIGLEEKETACRQRIRDLERLTAEQPTGTQHHNLAMYYHELGKLLTLKAKDAVDAARKRKAGRPPEVDAMVAEAEESFEQAVELHEALARAKQDVARYRRSLAQHYIGLGDLFLWTARQPQRSQAPYRAALDLYKELAANDATAQGELGCTHEKLGQMWLRLAEPNPASARDHLTKAVSHLQTALHDDPANRHFQKILGDATKALNDLRPERKP